MKLHQILSPSFRSILAQLHQEPFTLYHPASMVQRSSSICSQFCQALVGCGYLLFEQMLHAVYRYRLGASTKGGVIFWQIDHEGNLHDGKVMYYQTAQEVMASPFWEGSPPIRVSTILEQHATPAQKAAKIDLIDFLFNH